MLVQVPGQQYEHRWVSATANAVQEETISRVGGKRLMYKTYQTLVQVQQV